MDAVTLPYEIVVVDNHSLDDNLQDLDESPRCRILRQSENLGFAKACNIGAKAARGDVLHFLNPDCLVRSDINASYALVAASQERCLYSTQIMDSNGALVGTSHVLPTLKNLFLMFSKPASVSRWHIGASILIRPDLFQEIGGFSEDYFMYAEDLDLFYKAQLAGIYSAQTESKVIHHSGGASKKVWSSWQRLLRTEASAQVFTHKYGLGLSYFLFKHLAFLKTVWSQPTTSTNELSAYWYQLLGLNR